MATPSRVTARWPYLVVRAATRGPTANMRNIWDIMLVKVWKVSLRNSEIKIIQNDYYYDKVMSAI